MNDADFRKFMHTIDPDGSGEVTYNEFMKVVGGSIAGAPTRVDWQLSWGNS